MKITKNFKSEEFKCKDGTEVPTPLLHNVKKLCEQLEIIRTNLEDRPIKITSGYRTNSYNNKVGGAKYSQHLQGKAADIQVANKTPQEVFTKIIELMNIGFIEQGGVILYKTFVHYDIRGHKVVINNG